jgi:DNA helicase HerA-like ATPase
MTLRRLRDSLRERNNPNLEAEISDAPDDVDWALLPEQSLIKVFTEAFKLAELEIWPEAAGLPSLDEVIGDFSSLSSDQRLLVIDLPSLYHDQAQAMLADRALELIWRNARSDWLEAVKRPAADDPRVPTFIVIDEAHNLVPTETSGAIEASVKARLTRIAAEGRKYGLFLVLVTQRPSRLSSDVLSQVENLFLLKLTNRIDLEFIQQTFGTLDPELVRQAAGLGLGQFILTGRLAPHPVVLKGLPRRTEEGGRSIQATAWLDRRAAA